MGCIFAEERDSCATCKTGVPIDSLSNNGFPDSVSIHQYLSEDTEFENHCPGVDESHPCTCCMCFHCNYCIYTKVTNQDLTCVKCNGQIYALKELRSDLFESGSEDSDSSDPD